MRRYALLFLSVFAVSMVFAQPDDDYFRKKKNKRENSKQFEDKLNWGDAIYAYVSSKYRPFGWHIDPGVTYMLGNSAPEDYTASGLPGYYVGIGLQHLFKKVHVEQDPSSPFYVDYGLGVKHFGGREKYKDPDVTNTTSTNFNFGSAFARANFHGVIQLNPWTFIDQSIGANFDYCIYGGKQFTNNGTGTKEGKMVLGLNYTFGWGMKIRDGFFVIPTLQMPIMKFISWQGFNPSHVWFNSRYEPMIVTLKFGWLFPKKGCPPVMNNDMDKQRSDQYQMR